MQNLIEAYKAANIGQQYFELELEDYKIGEQTKKYVRTYLDDLVNYLNQGMGFVFTGRPGSGKTMLASIILKEAIKKGFSCYSANLDEIKNIILTSYDDLSKKDSAHKKLFGCKLLLIDDFPQTLAFKSQEKTEDIIYSVLKRRVKERKTTLITTTLNQTEIASKFGEKLTSLFDEIAINVAMPDEDYRSKYIRKPRLEDFRNKISEMGK